MQSDIHIRPVCAQDAEAIARLYAYYVENTAVSFEYDAPDAGEMLLRMQRIMGSYPYLVAERGGELLGYAYASPFHTRAAYGWAAESTVYVKRDIRRMGVGGALYSALENVLKLQGVLNLNACIACPEKEDEYLSLDSVRFHERAGFTPAGRIHSCGCKFGRWYDIVWMEKLIGAHGSEQAAVKPFPEILELAIAEGMIE